MIQISYRFWYHAEQIERVQDENDGEKKTDEEKEKESDIIYNLSLGAILLTDTGKRK